MAAALKALLAVAHWRWTPFFGLLGGALLYVGIVLLVVPTKINGPSPRAKESLVVLTDESSPLSASVARDPRASAVRSPSMHAQPALPTRPPEPSLQPEPHPPQGMMAPQLREVEPRPQPEPPQPPPPPPAQPVQPDEEDEEGDEDEEDEHGAAPPPPRNRALAGALRMLPRPIQSVQEE
jgi:hypothetical protein